MSNILESLVVNKTETIDLHITAKTLAGMLW